jgi:hypothetical protein
MKTSKTELIEKARAFLSNFRFKRQEAADGVEVEGKTISRSFRVYDFFESREGVEDDDGPNFTGEKEARAQLISAMPDELKKCELSIDDNQEKAWFSVSIHVK